MYRFHKLAFIRELFCLCYWLLSPQVFMTRLSNRRGHFGKDYVSSLSMPDRYAGIRRVRETLRFGYVQTMVVMRACVRSVANEQGRQKRLVIITRGRFAIRLNPLRVLCAERIVHLSLKLGITRNFSDED
jgi:hypothetical protein